MNSVSVVRVKLDTSAPLVFDHSITCPKEAVEAIGKEIAEFDREHFCVVNLDNKGRILNMNIAAIGVLQECWVHPREIFKSAILSNAANIIVLHNHPSGVLTPSEPDDDVTKRLFECGELLGVHLLDSIIVGPGTDKYYSYGDEGVINELRFKHRNREEYER